ncbi:hypothetical protein V2J09_007976 [Rumex salicifolius]
MDLNRAGLMVFVAIAIVASYSIMEVSCTRLGHSNTNNTSGGGWGWGWAGPGYNRSGGPGGGWGWGWGGAGYNRSGGPGGGTTSGGGGWGWGWGGPGYNRSGGPSGCPTARNETRSGPNKIMVGGSKMWNFGFNYSDWAMKTAPFYLNDHSSMTPQVTGRTRIASICCQIGRVTKIGNGKGFEYKLRKWQPYYFACGESNGFHCKTGMMKFFVVPVFHWTR